jgi:outer membrane protein TolC
MPNPLVISVLIAGFVAPVAPAEGPSDPPPGTSAGAGARAAADLDDRVRRALAPRPGGLTAEQVAERAVATSPQVEAMRAELMINASSVDSTIAQFSPDVTLSASYTRISPADISFGSGGASVGALNEGPLFVDPGTGMVVDSAGSPVGAAEFGAIEVPLDNYALTASLSIPFMDYALRLLPAKRGADARTEAAVLQRDAEKVRVQLDAQLAYYDWLRSLAQVAVLEQSVEEVNARISDAKVGLAAGVLTQADVHQLEGGLSNTEAGLHQARSFSRLAEHQLGVIMAEPNTRFEVGEDVLREAPDPWKGEKQADLVEEAYASRLELKALSRGADSMRYARRTAAAGYYPRLDGFAEATYANPNQRFFPATDEWNGSWLIGVTLSWRLSAFLQARSQVKLARGNERKMVANEMAMEQAIQMEVAAAWQERERALAALEFAERSRDSAELVYDHQVALYRGGEVTTTDLLIAESRLLNETLRDANARIDLRVADAKLNRATGRMKPLAVPQDEDDKPHEKAGPGRAK